MREAKTTLCVWTSPRRRPEDGGAVPAKRAVLQAGVGMGNGVFGTHEWIEWSSPGVLFAILPLLSDSFGALDRDGCDVLAFRRRGIDEIPRNSVFRQRIRIPAV